jgi:hypothetical protein
LFVCVDSSGLLTDLCTDQVYTHISMRLVLWAMYVIMQSNFWSKTDGGTCFLSVLGYDKITFPVLLH